MMGSVGDRTDYEVAECEKPLGRATDPKLLNPRNYAFVPSCYTTQIRAAGRITNRSAAIKAVF